MEPIHKFGGVEQTGARTVMDLWAAMDAVRAAWSDEHVCGVARAFLAECDWGLESGDGWIRVPPNADLVVYSAAVIVSQYGFGDHVEAIVYLGADQSPSGIFPVHGVLRLYLNAAGQVLTEDWYTPAEWWGRS